MPDAIIAPKPLPMAEAITYWRDQVPMTRAAFDALGDEARARAFFVSGLARLDQTAAVHAGVLKTLEQGGTLRDFQRDLGGVLDSTGLGDNPWRLETIFRTNVQNSYMAGHYAQMMSVADTRPYWRYVAVLDNRTRPAHRALHNLVRRYDDPFWRVWFPPNGFNCRCTVQAVTEDEVRELGLEIGQGIPDHLVDVDPVTGMETSVAMPAPDKGFDHGPADYWQPDLSRYPADLKQGFYEGLVDGVCPDEFAGGGNTCLARFKRHLRQEDLQELETMIWSRMQGGVEGFGDWAAEVIQRGQARGELYPVGNLPGLVLAALRDKGLEPRLALVVITDAQVLHLAREAKLLRGTALTPEEIAAIPAQFLGGEWWRDAQDPAVVMTWSRSGDAWIKVVIRLDRTIAKEGVMANQVVTAGAVKLRDIEGQARYVKI